MGFLSLKKNKQPPPAAPEPQLYEPTPSQAVAEEQHPIVEELAQMEAAVPERHYDDAYEESLEADRPLREDQVESYTDEDYEEEGYDDEPAAPEAPVNADPVVAPPAPVAEVATAEPEVEEDDGRMKAVDLIAPTRLDFLK